MKFDRLDDALEYLAVECDGEYPSLLSVDVDEAEEIALLSVVRADGSAVAATLVGDWSDMAVLANMSNEAGSRLVVKIALRRMREELAEVMRRARGEARVERLLAAQPFDPGWMEEHRRVLLLKTIETCRAAGWSERRLRGHLRECGFLALEIRWALSQPKPTLRLQSSDVKSLTKLFDSVDVAA